MFSSIFYSSLNQNKSISYCIAHVLSIIGKSNSTKRFNVNTFCHPTLTSEELQFGAKLGVDSWADTCCADRHCYVEEFVEGKVVNATGFTPSLGAINSLPIAHVLYAFDAPNSLVYILECNNAIYLGEEMIDSLMNPIQCEENNFKADIRPQAHHPSCDSAQSIQFNDGTTLQLLYDGVLPYLPIRRPTKSEIHYCKRLTLTSHDN